MSLEIVGNENDIKHVKTPTGCHNDYDVIGKNSVFQNFVLYLFKFNSTVQAFILFKP